MKTVRDMFKEVKRNVFNVSLGRGFVLFVEDLGDNVIVELHNGTFIGDTYTNININGITFNTTIEELKRKAKMIINKEFKDFIYMPIPRYHLKDGDIPQVVDVYETYPNEKLTIIQDNGYTYVGTSKGKKLFMSMHCMSNDIEEVKEYIEFLKNLRSNNSFKDLLD